jgi:hypothetical protein
MSLFMKPVSKRRLERMAELTRQKCEECPSIYGAMKPARCCDKFFCELTTETIRELGGEPIPHGTHPELPYMGENGCVVPPHLRPVCSGFVCQAHLERDHGFASKWEALQKKLNEDPNLVRAMDKARNAMGGVIGAIERFRAEHLIEVDPDTGEAPKPQS